MMYPHGRKYTKTAHRATLARKMKSVAESRPLKCLNHEAETKKALLFVNETGRKRRSFEIQDA